MKRTNVLIFSFNRPMQLDLLLKSFQNCIEDIESVDVYVLYGDTSKEFESAYEICKLEHQAVTFIKQEFFYTDIKQFLKTQESDFLLFCTDDTIFTRKFSIKKIEKTFDDNKNLLNFSLRLGQNTTYCYPLNKSQIASWNYNSDDVFYWDWRSAEDDFGYPMEISSTVLRTRDVKMFVDACVFSDPNWMEWYMDLSKTNFVNKYTSACFPISVAFSAPMNKVRPANKNRSSLIQQYTTDSLLEKYLQGYRIDFLNFDKYTSKGAHEEVEYEFIKKERKTYDE